MVGILRDVVGALFTLSICKDTERLKKEQAQRDAEERARKSVSYSTRPTGSKSRWVKDNFNDDDDEDEEDDDDDD